VYVVVVAGGVYAVAVAGGVYVVVVAGGVYVVVVAGGVYAVVVAGGVYAVVVAGGVYAVVVAGGVYAVVVAGVFDSLGRKYGEFLAGPLTLGASSVPLGAIELSILCFKSSIAFANNFLIQKQVDKKPQYALACPSYFLLPFAHQSHSFCIGSSKQLDTNFCLFSFQFLQLLVKID
jgi:hypothetical protein